jgi:hypothetical protein
MAPRKKGGGEKPKGGTPMKKEGAEKRKGGHPAKKGAAPGQKGGTHLKNGGHPAEKGDAPFFQTAAPKNPRSDRKARPCLKSAFRLNAPPCCPLPQQITQVKIKRIPEKYPSPIRVFSRGVHWP